ncbi:MAG TPA: cyclic nucleotide-binding domain-containing protein [Burkholderiaceae bacterium]|nr:cyclic nucleotide-binding domain-containing protein [Burkholderiaceae bacterium]
MTATRIELLQQMPIFGAVRNDALALLLQAQRSREVAAGDYFFRERDPAQSMFVLEVGRASVLKQWQGRELALHRLGPGDCFGEMALLDLFPRSAAVRALDECLAIELTPADLLRLFERDSEQFALVQMNIAREMCRRLRATDEMLFAATMGGSDAAPGTNFQVL